MNRMALNGRQRGLEHAALLVPITDAMDKTVRMPI